MAIKVGQAFERTSAQPIDTSLTLTKAQMVTVNDNLMPPYYFTICQDDGKIYLYDKSATASASTGKFSEFSGGSGSGSPVYLSATLLDKDINDPTIVALSNLTKADNPTVHPILSEIVLGTTVIYDADGTMGVATAKSGTNVTVTTATTSTPTKELTQAEYDALTEAEKKNGTIYFITDNYVGSTYVGALESIYSTTERVIGSWMGKPLYQRTFYLGSSGLTISNSSWTDTGVEIASDVDAIVSAKGHATQGRSTTDNGAFDVHCNADSGVSNYQLLAARTTSLRIWWFTLQYTKTTDTASAVEYASPNDYSTSEKIVGSYNGKPLYQKSWFDLEDDYILPTNGWVDIPTVSLSGVDKLVDCVVMSNQTMNTPSADYIFSFAYGWDKTAGHLILQNIRSTSNSIGVDGRKYDVTIKYTKVSS